MSYPWANTVLLSLLILQLLTGGGGLISGAKSFSWVLWLHGVGGYAIAVLLVWKGAIVVDVLKRPWRWSWPRVAFIGLTILLLLILITGWLWSYNGPTYLGGFSLIVLHGLLACGLVGLLGWHLVARRYVWRVPTARNRRAVLRLAGVGLAGLALRQLAEPAKFLVHLPGAGRRFTGSYEVGSFRGVFPETSWLFDRPEPIDPARWQLIVEGAVRQPLTLSYDELNRLVNLTESALLDCTGGFYTEQEWTGLPLAWLLEKAGVQPGVRSVTVEAVSGYKRRFSLAVAKTCLLATQVGYKPISHGHGFPLRLVVPGYRGYDWVKWVSRIRVNKTSHLRQPPLPLQ